MPKLMIKIKNNMLTIFCMLCTLNHIDIFIKNIIINIFNMFFFLIIALGQINYKQLCTVQQDFDKAWFTLSGKLRKYSVLGHLHGHNKALEKNVYVQV